MTALELTDVRKVYTMGDGSEVVALDQATLTVADDEIIALVGPSGSGKTTLCSIAGGILSPTSGRVVVGGRDISSYSPRELTDFRREAVGFVFQTVNLIPFLTARENLLVVDEIGPHERRRAGQRADQLLEGLGLSDRARNLPSQLSGGMQQRVGLARALASDPDILLMDEAFSALDPLIRRQMQDEMMAIQKKLRKTILFITHDLNEALRIGDRVCIMRGGRIVQIGTPEEILTKPATGYVAEFVQDVDQGRVILVSDVMVEPKPVDRSATLGEAVKGVSDRAGAFVLDDVGRPVAVLTVADGLRSIEMGSDRLDDALRSDFETAGANQTLNEVYASAGRGLPIAVVDDDGRLVGNLDPRHIMEELGRVEGLIDGFEREVFL